MKKKRILFVVESITTAQVVRLLLLAQSLDRSRYEVFFATGDPSSRLFLGSGLDVRAIDTLPSTKIFARLEAGNRPYEKSDLKRYVEVDLALLDEVRPDLVVSDFRLSLTVSARVARVPLATLINAYWSPYAVRERFPIPDHPILDRVGLELAERYFPKALPHVLRHFAAPINSLRKRHGLRPLRDLLCVLTDGEIVLYPDAPELTPTEDLPEHHVYLGPLCWSA
ncbi:MAG: glycosyl transferase family 1, partial [Polyangiaceae bacterium]|nr:glycosyl transferase family 1 [Polyangiaceae bacterium]